MEDINRIKVVLAEKKRTNKWLAEDKNVSIVEATKMIFSSDMFR